MPKLVGRSLALAAGVATALLAGAPADAACVAAHRGPNGAWIPYHCGVEAPGVVVAPGAAVAAPPAVAVVPPHRVWHPGWRGPNGVWHPGSYAVAP